MTDFVPIEPGTALHGLLEECPSLHLATLNRDGTPHLSTVWYTVLDGCIAFWTQRGSPKAANLRRNPQVACLGEAGASYGEIRGANISGTAELTDDPQTLVRIGHGVFERHFPAQDRGRADEIVAGGKRVGMLVRVYKAATWDNRGTGRTLPTP